MLIILSGAETINKRQIAARTIETLNTFEVNGYTVTWKNRLPTVVDSQGVEQLVATLDNDTLSAINALQVEVFNEGINNNHYGEAFSDLYSDFGLTDTVVYAGDPLLGHPCTYEHVLASYNDRKYENFVISGIFSKSFVNAIRNDLGVGDTTVLNITRHPSVSFLLNAREPNYYDNIPDLTAQDDHDKLLSSILNQFNLSQLAYVNTIRFEDILRTHNISVADTAIDLSWQYLNHNAYLTGREYGQVIPKNLVTESELNDFNNFLTNFEAPADLVNDYNQTNGTVFTPADFANIPKDLFGALHYSAIDRATIIDRLSIKCE